MPSITVQRAPVAEMGYGKRAEHGLGAWLPIGRLPRVRPLLRLESSLFSSLKGAPAKADGLCGEAEMPSHWRNFLLAGNGAVWLVR